MVLETELRYFEKNRDKFLADHKDKFVLIKGECCHGVYDDDKSAYEAGVDLFGTEPFLIKQVLPEDFIDQIPALMYGLISASV